MSIDSKIIENLKAAGIYDQLAAQIGKDATVADVHVSSTGGKDDKKKKPLTFTENLAEDDKAEPKAKNLEGDGWSTTLMVMKAIPDQQLIFGWASVSMVNNAEVIDKQGDIIPIAELEKAAYDFTLYQRTHGDMHTQIGTGHLVESVVFTPEKAALGLVAKNEKGETVYGWWTGFKVSSDELWAAHKRGERPDYSIGGRARGEPA